MKYSDVIALCIEAIKEQSIILDEKEIELSRDQGLEQKQERGQEVEDDEDPGQKCYYRRFKFPRKPPGQPERTKCADCSQHLEMDNKSTICIRCIWKTAWIRKQTM